MVGGDSDPPQKELQITVREVEICIGRVMVGVSTEKLKTLRLKDTIEDFLIHLSWKPKKRKNKEKN